MVTPVVCFSLGNHETPVWQSGRTKDLARLFLLSEVNSAFASLIALSAVASIATMARSRTHPTHTNLPPEEPRASRWSAALLAAALHVGMAISIQYIVIIGIMVDFELVLLGLIPVGGVAFTRVFAQLSPTKISPVVFVAVVVTAVVFQEMSMVALVLSLSIFGPIWALLAYGASLRMLPRAKPRLSLAALFSLYGAAWWHSIQQAREYYESLPIEPPESCFIVTAASRGHSSIVSPTQLIYFKAAEFRLQSVAPRLHAMSRVIYNRIGPVLARRISNPWIADAVYVALKPFEWFVRVVF